MLHQLTSWLLAPSGLMPHGFCLLWNPGLIWLHALSDACVGLAYFSIPVTLAAVVRRRPDLADPAIVPLFAAFIVLCGLGHFFDLLTLWVPAYPIEGLVKAATAAVAVLSAMGLRRLVPRLLQLPSPAQLREAHHDLGRLREAESRMAATAQEASAARDALAGELARREAAEQQALESEERFRLLLQSNVAEALYLLDCDGRIETWNAAAERIKGYSAEEIVGQNFARFFTPEDLAQGLPARLLAQARETGRFSTEGWRVRKGGERFLAKMSIDAIRRPDGTLRGFVKVTQDITDRQIEEEQRAIIVEAAPNGMIIVDERGVITLANRQVSRILGDPDCAMVGQSWEVFIPPGQRDAHALLRAALTEGLGSQATTPQQSFVAHRRDGSEVVIDLIVNTVRTPRGHIVVASLTDVTERVRDAAARAEEERRQRGAAEAAHAELDRLSRNLAEARDRAEQANQAKSRFLASITHELRTPLHGLLGYAELLTLEGGLSPKQTKRLETMMAAGEHLLGMVNAVLDMSQIEADKLELHLGSVDLTDLIGVCLNVIRPAAEARGLVLGPPPAAASNVVADPTRLRQVLINLLGNAVKFTPTGSVAVRVRGTDSATVMRVEVVDTGPGVRPAHRDKLFNTFERLNANAFSGIEGTGLGLAISARLIQLMGGAIGYADNPGGGSIFWLELPMSQDAPTAAAPQHLAQPRPAAPRLRVLLVDDEALNRSIAGSFLAQAGHEVIAVDNGAAAVAAATAEDFDVVLMDVRMPGMNGMEATRRIRALPGARGRVRVVAVTAQAFAEQIELCRQAGMDAHVSKPFKQATLLAALRADAGLSAAPPAEPATRAAVATEPLFDRDIFAGLMGSLPPQLAQTYLTSLLARCEAMLARLRRPGALNEATALVEDAHKLAGSAGMFGLVAVGTAARAFEHAAETGASDTALLAQRLEAALAAAMRVLQQEIGAAVDS